jgi:putative Ca2+/H+ antiporter (TMEM165/GDT1 family)
MHMMYIFALFAPFCGHYKWGILAAASCALTLATFFAVVIGSELDRFVSARTIKVISGIGFIGIGIWTLLTAK